MRPEHIFPNDVEDWDRNVFLGASHFNVVIPRHGTYHGLGTFPEALECVGRSRNALIYAVTKSGRSTILERRHWDKFLNLWNVLKEKLNAEKWEVIKQQAEAEGVDPYTQLFHYLEMDPKQFRRAKKR